MQIDPDKEVVPPKHERNRETVRHDSYEGPFQLFLEFGGGRISVREGMERSP